jgi:Asp-tRNA(Asn)/Glu-tRNA(Gln) amidotransferase A subunit family amidase
VREPWRLTAAEAARAIAAGQLTSEALVRSCLERIEVREPEVQAWAWLDPKHAIEQARARDRAVRSGPLHGIPVGVKDVFDTFDMPTQQNSVIREGHRPGQDAAAVALLRSAGAVILGKTHTQEFGSGGRFAPTSNPHNAAHSPGASSGGSAAAVGAGMVPLALGTQTGGSLLRPASYCGIYALKPTWNVVSREGVKGSSITQDTVGSRSPRRRSARCASRCCRAAALCASRCAARRCGTAPTPPRTRRSISPRERSALPALASRRSSCRRISPGSTT